MNNKLIFDIGMHTGDDTQYYLSLGYKVIAVEANPILVEICKNTFKKEIANGFLQIINKGISTQNGKFNFYINTKNSEWSSFDKKMGGRNNTETKEISVETIILKDLFNQYGIPFYLKIDIEGNDKFCLESIDANNKPKYVSCEANTSDLIDILTSKGYTKFKMINQANGFYPFCYINEVTYFPSLFTKVIWKIKKIFLKNYITYGDTGPFGESTKGQWKTSFEIKKEFNSYYKNNKPINLLSWYDFHATY
jgi:FkbM family methyltransferase